MKETLHKRKKMAVVRLEAANPLSKELEKYFCEKFKIEAGMYFQDKDADEAGFYLRDCR